jgi:hypothetical protein
MSESWEAETSIENMEDAYPLVKIPLREKTIQMTGQSHLNKHCEYYLFTNLDLFMLLFTAVAD